MAMRRRTKLALGLLAGVGLVALGAWLWREPIARSVIDDELATRTVPAAYTIEHLGTDRQRLTNVRLGDPANPDLTAEWAEIETGWSLSGPVVRTIRAGGVRLNARLTDGRFSMGSVDKLLPAPTGEPFALPDWTVQIDDARLRLRTDQGLLHLAMRGKGNLANGFAGTAGLVSQELNAGDCRAQGLGWTGQIRTQSRRIALDGPLTLATLRCGTSAADNVKAGLKLESDEAFGDMAASADLTTAALSFAGYRSQSASGQFSANGGTKRFSTDYQMVLAKLSGEQGRAASATVTGSGQGRFDKGFRFESAGDVKLAGLVPGAQLSTVLDQLGSGESGSPMQPLVSAIRSAVQGLQRGSDGSARYTLRQEATGGMLSLGAIKLDGRSGARLALDGEAPLSFRWPDGALAINGNATLAGGGFPSTLVKLDARGGAIEGIAVMQPWSAQGARLTLSPARFRLDGKRWSVDTRARLDGPLGGGRVEGLDLALSLASGRDLLAGCFVPRFTLIKVDTLALRNGQITACMEQGQAVIRRPRLAGSLGTSPLLLSASEARIGFARGDFSASGVSVLLGAAQSQSRLEAGRVLGSLGKGGASGTFQQMSGQLAEVPLLIDQGSGRWQLNGGNATAQAAVQVNDASPEARFKPLIVPDLALAIRDGVARAEGMMRNAPRDVDVAKIFITHRLGPGTGEAVIDMAGLTFGSHVQPEELTPITLGVIANVEGTLRGTGTVRWSPQGVTSTGQFGTAGMDMAAAFGPVTGLSGEVQFSDLLGLETPPGQQVRLGGVNPGIAVLDGLISYRLLPGLKAQIEGGSWPFAGGQLRLEPTIIDLNQSAERRLTFKVEGMDIARFIAAMEFENIAATGTFDGELPMVFDATGGRIEGGQIVARDGGSVSYVGQLSNEKIGAMGQFAFDALKSIKYSRLSITLDGAIDGDVITRISFAGINQAPINGVRAKFPIPVKVTGLTNIPFIFNVTITAKFRQLFEMARSFNDPSVLINRMIPRLEPVPGEPAKSVQPSERPPTP